VAFPNARRLEYAPLPGRIENVVTATACGGERAEEN
jgi:hypothetical protein